MKSNFAIVPILFAAIGFFPVLSHASNDSFSGTWAPNTRNYWSEGELTFRKKTLKWLGCTAIPFDVIRKSAQEYAVELKPSKKCTISRERIVLFELHGDDFMDVSFCDSRLKIDRQKGDRGCSWGTYSRKP